MPPPATVTLSLPRKWARSCFRPPSPGGRPPRSPLPNLQHFSRKLAQPLSHPPLPPHAPPSSRTWPSGRAVRVPVALYQLRASDASRLGKTRFASDALGFRKRGEHPQAMRGMTTPFLYGPRPRPQMKLCPSLNDQYKLQKARRCKTDFFLLPVHCYLAFPETGGALISREAGKGAGFETWRTTWTR